MRGASEAISAEPIANAASFLATGAVIAELLLRPGAVASLEDNRVYATSWE
jgi:hypothetical protein